MRPARSLLAGVAAVTVLGALVATLGSRNRPTSAADRRASTLLTEPNGARAYADALERLGVRLERMRQFQLGRIGGDSLRTALIVLDPTVPLSPSQAVDLTELPGRGVSLMVVGSGAAAALRCFGYSPDRLEDSVAVVVTGANADSAPRVGAVLRETGVAEVVDSSGMFDATIAVCRVPDMRSVDTLAMAGGRPVALRLRPDQAEGDVVVVSDVGLFRNRTLRVTAAGPMVLGWVAGRYDQVWFDEVHHGFVTGGSLAAWTIRWSRESPWGWLGWHVAIVGLLALVAGAIRFGPPQPALDRRRRSVAEHVRALALALRAAGGHGVAIGLMVGGLRRRLTVGGRSTGDWRAWLDGLVARAPNRRLAELGARLQGFDRGRASEAEVLETAHIVEDMWKELGS